MCVCVCVEHGQGRRVGLNRACEAKLVAPSSLLFKLHSQKPWTAACFVVTFYAIADLNDVQQLHALTYK